MTTGSEREVLAGFLELYRGILVRKLAALSDGDARRSLVPSSTTLLGLVKHLALVEREWFGQILGQLPAAQMGLPVPGDGSVVGADGNIRSQPMSGRDASDSRISSLG